MMRQLSRYEIRQIQMNVLQEFHDFCIKNDIKYSLCAGTLLGAIRHKGYIPWDDDIDVMVPRRDYQRLLKLYNSDNYTLYHYSKQKSFMLSYAKLCDNSTLLEEGCVFESDYGVDIDIFPLDFFPDTIEESEQWVNRLKRLKYIRNRKNVKVSKNRSLFKNVQVILFRILTSPIPMRWLVKKVDTIAQLYSYKTEGFVGNMTNGYGMKERNPMSKQLIDIEFEGRSFKAIANYDVYLKGLFNDYMTLPPLDKRVSTHTAVAWWR